jgi:hypothetical protein
VTTIIIENAGELLHSLKKWCQTPMALP